MCLISVIIPTRNRSRMLAPTLMSLVGQMSPPSYEIIVVDNASTDDTPEKIRQFQDSYQDISIRYVRDDMPGLLTGRHRGAREAGGDILSFIDDDVEVSPGWVRGIASGFDRHPDVHLLTGPSFPQYESHPPQWLSFFWGPTPYRGKECSWLSLLDLGDSEMLIHPHYVWGLNFSIRRKTFDDLKGFHPDNIPDHLQMFQGDGETGLTAKVAAKKYKAMYSPAALLHHKVPLERMTAAYFGKRAFYHGVCDSFTELRCRAGKDCPSSSNHASWLDSILYKAELAKNRLRWGLASGSGPLAEAKEILKQSAIRRREGYHFHQRAFHGNDVVRQWVLRDDYMNYEIPLPSSGC